MTQHYRFEHVWQVPRPLDEAFAVLADIDGYPHWWRQVRSVQRLDEDTRVARMRSLLPVTLDVTMTRVVEEPATGTLRAGLDGDLTGWAQWQLSWEGGTTTAARWTQEVDLTHPRLQHLPAAGRRGLELNHTWMMRSGEQGLHRWLARP